MTSATSIQVVRQAFSLTTLFSLLVLAGGCKKDDSHARPAKDQIAATGASKPGIPAAQSQTDTTKPVSSKPVAEITPVERVAAAVGIADGLPDLKPINKKPFPDGATEEQVCEAIQNSKEEDLWVRFGHIVPMYLYGSLMIVEAKQSQIDDLKKVILQDGYVANYKTCDDKQILIYSRGMPNENIDRDGSPRGMPHLIEQFSKQLQIKTSESFALQANHERLSDYCRADAQLCEDLVKLDWMNKSGLCNRAILNAGTDANKKDHLALCEELAPRIKSCAYVRWTPHEGKLRNDCICKLRSAFGLSHDTSCQ